MNLKEFALHRPKLFKQLLRFIELEWHDNLDSGSWQITPVYAGELIFTAVHEHLDNLVCVSREHTHAFIADDESREPVWWRADDLPTL